MVKKRKSLGSAGELQAQPKASMFSLLDHKSTALVPRPHSSSSHLVEKKPIKMEPDAIEWSEIESKNRDLLNKVVLEEMRRRGLKDYRKDKDQRAKSVMPAGEEVLEVAVLGEEREQWRKWEAERKEYKGVFHHTVKAAAFALRHDGFSEVTIVAERMKNTNDPMPGSRGSLPPGFLLLLLLPRYPCRRHRPFLLFLITVPIFLYWRRRPSHVGGPQEVEHCRAAPLIRQEVPHSPLPLPLSRLHLDPRP